MAFALTSFRAFPVNVDEPITTRALQVVTLKITALAADVDLDIGDTAGTFWTAALADATYGTKATEAKKHMATILANAETLKSLYSFEIAKNKRVSSGPDAVATKEVKYNGTATAPEILFFAGEGITSLTVTLEYVLKPEQRSTAYAY